MLRVFETFSGIGAQTKALANIGVNHKVVAISEWDINAIIAYAHVHHLEELKTIPDASTEDMLAFLKGFTLSGNGKTPLKSYSRMNKLKLAQLYKSIKVTHCLGSILDIQAEQIPDFDLLTYSFPCQAISLQGKQEGLQKGTGTSSSLLWEIERILLQLKEANRLPKYLLMENVAHLFSNKFISFYNEWEQFLSDLGYTTSKAVVDATQHGSAQARKRAFAVSVLNAATPFEFPAATGSKAVIKDKLDANAGIELPDLVSKLKCTDATQIPFKKSGIKSTVLENYTTFQSENLVYFAEGICPTITANGAQSRLKIVDTEGKLRYMSAREHWKLMGFEGSDFDKAQTAGLSETIYKKQAGNSICVEVLEALFKEMLKK